MRVLDWWRGRILWTALAAAMIGVGVTLVQPYVAARVAGDHTAAWSDPLFDFAFFLVVAGSGFAAVLAFVTWRVNRWRGRLVTFIRRGHVILGEMRIDALTEHATGKAHNNEWN